MEGEQLYKIIYSEDEALNQVLGEKGTPARDKYEEDMSAFLVGETIRKARQSKNMTQEELNRFFVDKARLALNDGAMFGKEGEGFMRLNVASPRSVLEKAMKQLADAYAQTI